MYCFYDFANNYQIGFQDAATPFMEALISLYNLINICLIIIFSIVSWMIFRTIYIYGYNFKLLDFYSDFLNISEPQYERLYVTILNKNHYYSFSNVFIKYLTKRLQIIKNTHNHLLEIIWTITPSILLILIAIPSFVLLYAMDELILASITIKVIGHQWYWSYEYSDYILQFLENAFLNLSENNNILNLTPKEYIGCSIPKNDLEFMDSINIEFDSYMIPEDELISGQLRLLEVDNPLVVPIRTHIRILVTSTDVLHSWCIPSLGIKMDAVPGRLNQTSFFIKRVGTFYGQCSEICGVNHGFMPIVVESVKMKNYISWLNSMVSSNN